MKFGSQLTKAIYEPWREQYLDYSGLKKQLKKAENSDHGYTEKDESAFVEKLDQELEKIYAFQNEQYRIIQEQVANCESRVAALQESSETSNEDRTKMQDEINEISDRVDRLSKYARFNYTGVVKIVKKHDKRTKYILRPLFNVRLAQCKFFAENYDPVIYQLSRLYQILREAGGTAAQPLTTSISQLSATAPDGMERFVRTSFKFWVHPDNMMEVKTFCMRHLPILIYNPNSSAGPSNTLPDPSITSLYFDNEAFELYMNKIERKNGAESFRLRWYGSLDSMPKSEIFIERKISTANDGEESKDRFVLKEKNIEAFLHGEDVMKKRITKMREAGTKTQESIQEFEQLTKSFQDTIQEKNLQPVLRTYYHRTAFQIPGDQSVRISLDTDFVIIREDNFDADVPCRPDGFWRRREADGGPPFEEVPDRDKVTFPYGILEIKLMTKIDEEVPAWITELMLSHLVQAAPKFSKFTHGVASLFEGTVPLLPFWLSEMDKDIRKTPMAAEQAAGSFEPASLVQSPPTNASGFAVVFDKARKEKGKNKVGESRQRDLNNSQASTTDFAQRGGSAVDESTPLLGGGAKSTDAGLGSKIKSHWNEVFGPDARATYSEPVTLPANIRVPNKVTTPVKVETKVWFANERTYLKNTHVSLLLATFGLALINTGDQIARFSGLLYALISVGLLAYGWYVYQKRVTMIKNRDPGHFDDFIGPVIICLALFTAVSLNFYLKFQQLSVTNFWAVPGAVPFRT